MNWTVIFRDAVPACAGVTVYDKGYRDVLGRFVVAKVMKLANGKSRVTQTYYFQRQPALNYAVQFLKQRAAKFNREYVPGDGAKTMAYPPVPAGGVS